MRHGGYYLFEVEKHARMIEIKQIVEATKQLMKAFTRWLTFNHAIAANKEADAKEGYFSVIALNNGKSKKFLLKLRYLANPKFLKLLDAAAEEYGYDQKGVLVIPCDETELQRVLSKSHLDW